MSNTYEHIPHFVEQLRVFPMLIVHVQMVCLTESFEDQQNFMTTN